MRKVKKKKYKPYTKKVQSVDIKPMDVRKMNRKIVPVNPALDYNNR